MDELNGSDPTINKMVFGWGVENHETFLHAHNALSVYVFWKLIFATMEHQLMGIPTILGLSHPIDYQSHHVELAGTLGLVYFTVLYSNVSP